MKKAFFLLILAFLVIAMLITGLYAFATIALCVFAQEIHSFIYYLLLLASGIISGIICYILHKITF
jgi:hypothetical protein